MANNISVLGKVVSEYKKTGTVFSFRLLDKSFGKDNIDIFYDVKIFDQKLAEKVEKYVKNGDQVMIGGKFSIREYQGKNYHNLICNSCDFVYSQQPKETVQQVEKTRPESDTDDIPF